MRASDEEYFEYIYQSYYPQILKYLVRMIGNHEEAENLAQDVFLRMWKANDTIQAQCEQQRKGWLYTVATNIAFDYLRKRKAHRNDQNCEDPDTFEHPRRFERDTEERDHINQALKSLSEEERACLLLSIVGGFKQREIAELLAELLEGSVERSPAMIGWILSRAREKLRQAYRRLL